MHVEASEVARGGVQGEASVWGGEHVASEHSMCAHCALNVRSLCAQCALNVRSLCAHCALRSPTCLAGGQAYSVHTSRFLSVWSFSLPVSLPAAPRVCVFACLLAQVGLGACVCDLN